jgi:hypothetical protein
MLLTDFIPRTLSGDNGALFFTSLSLAAYKMLIPTCSKVLGYFNLCNDKCIKSVCVGTGIVAFLALARMRKPHRHMQFVSKWGIVFSFGTRLAGMRFVERYIDDANDAMNTLRILQTMVRTDKHIHKFIVENGGIETMVKAMKRYNEESDGVAASGSGLIEAVCGRSSETDKRLMECGAIRVLVEAMKQWPDNEEVQAQAARALNRLAAGKSCAIQKKIIDVGGLVALAEARTRHQHDARVEKPATNAIILLIYQSLSETPTQKE